MVLLMSIIVISIFASLYLSGPASGGNTSTTTGTSIGTRTITHTTASTSFTTTFVTTVTSGTNGCPSCLIAPQGPLDMAISYFTTKFNPQEGLISVGTEGTCDKLNETCGGVQFYYMDGSPCPIVAPAYRFLPNENWAVAAAFQGIGVQPAIVGSIYSHLQILEATVEWRPADNRESQWGYIVSSSKANTNICFTGSGGPPLPTLNGISIAYDQAARWNAATQSWIPGEFNLSEATNNSMSMFDEAGFQALNLYLRGDSKDAMSNLQWMADMCTVNSDGSVGFGAAPYRGMFLSVFLEAVEVIGSPGLKAGCSISAIAGTLWGIQQPDGGIARQYSDVSSCVSTCLSSDDETTNAALLAYSPGVILDIQQEGASRVFNLTSIPTVTPQIGI